MKIEHLSYLREIEKCKSISAAAKKLYIGQTTLSAIIKSIEDFLGQPEEKFPTNVETHGNSSSASCPILLDECNRKGILKKGDKIAMSAFGAGFISGAAIMEW